MTTSTSLFAVPIICFTSTQTAEIAQANLSNSAYFTLFPIKNLLLGQAPKVFVAIENEKN